VRAISPPLPAADDTAPRGVLRDGSVVQLRMAAQSDYQALARFFHELSPESRRLRFHGTIHSSDSFSQPVCGCSVPCREASREILQ